MFRLVIVGSKQLDSELHAEGVRDVAWSLRFFNESINVLVIVPPVWVEINFS